MIYSAAIQAWAMTMFLDNNGLIGESERPKQLSFIERIIIPGTVFIVCSLAMAAIGMLPGIPSFL